MGKFLEYVNGAKKGEGAKATSPKGGKFKRYAVEKTIGLDTLGTDLASVGSTLETIYGGWQDPDTLKKTRATVDDTYKRLTSAKDYASTYGADLGFDIDSVLSAYDTVLSDWEKLEGEYGYYQDADSYAKARKQSELATKFKQGMTYDQVQEALKQYEQGSDEYEYLRNYTGYSSLEDMDKALAGLEEGAKERVKQANANWKDLLSQGATPSPAKRDIDAKLNQEGFDWLGANAQSKPSTSVAQTGGEDFDWLDTSGVTGGGRSHSGGSALVGNDALKNKLQTLRNQYALDHASEPYLKVMENEDFEEKSQYVGSKGTDDAWWQDSSDSTYEFINNANGARDSIISAWDKNQANAPVYTAHPLVQKGLAYMNDDEIRVYNYLYATEGKEKANAYLDDIEVMLTKRATDLQAQSIEEEADGSALASVAMSAMSVPMNLGGAIYSGIDIASGMLGGEPYNPYGYYSGLSNASSAIRQSVGENIEEDTNWQIGGTNVARFLYDTGMSIGDSALGAVSMGHATAPLMGMTAYQQKAKEMTEAGESEEVIFQTALASGLAEAVFEYISIDKLLKIKNVDGIRRGITETLKQMGIEGSEEVATELANVLSDDLIRGDNSELAKMRSELESRGFNEEEINIELAKYVGEKLALAGIGGALSGGVMGGVASAGNYSSLSSDGKTIRESERMSDAFDMASLSPKESEAYKAYAEYAKKGVTADNASNAQLGNLSAHLQSDAIKTSESKKATIEERIGASIRLAEDKLHTPKTAKEKADEQKKKADERAVEQRLETLSVGKATEIASTGSATQIEGIKTDGGETVIVTSEGEVKASEMNFSQTDAELVAYAEGLSEEKANLFISQYDGKSKVSDYATSFELAYSYGETGFGADNVLAHKGVLSEAQASEIYKGAMYNKAKALQINVDAINAKHSGATSFVEGAFKDDVINYGEEDVEGKVKWSSLSKTQQRSIKFMGAFAKKAGVNISLVASKVVDGKHKGKNGSYNPETNTIEIDVYAGRLDASIATDAIIPTLSHELTHWMKAKSPAMYRAMQEIAMSNLGNKYNVDGYVKAEKERLDKEHGKGHTDEDAIDEIVARTCEDMLANSKSARQLLNKLSVEEQKTLVGKAKEYLNNLIAWADDLLGAYSSNSEEAKLLKEYKKAFEEMSAMWDKALEDAIKTNQSLQKEGITGENALATNRESQYSIRNEYVGEIEQWVRDGKPEGEVFILGSTGDVLQGLGAIESDIYMHGDKINSILNDHAEMTIDEIKKIPQILENPVLILKSKNVGRKTKGNTRLVIFGTVKAKDGKPILSVLDLRPTEKNLLVDDMQKVSSAYTKDTMPVEFVKSSDVLYADKKITTSLLRTIGFIAPIELNESGYIGSISYIGQNVKLEGKPFEDVVNVKGVQNADREITPLSETDYETLKSHFGTTGNFKVAGYMLPDGAMLDFSGKHWGDTTSRTRQVDHRDVWDVWSNMGRDGTDEMVNMIGNGNIRLMPENGGINLAKLPTDAQRKALEDYINHFNGEVVVDIDRIGGDTVQSFQYDKGTSASKIFADIENYFRGGRQSDLMRFHSQYSDRDSDGNSLTEEQQKYFANSQVRDANGNLKVMYHGTGESFTVFDKKKARSSGYYGSGFYFTESESHASQYGSSHKVYLNITNPLHDGTNDITKAQLKKFVQAIADNEDFGIENYGYGATVDSVVNSVWGKDDFGMIMDINATCVGDMVEALLLFNEVNGSAYDGIFAPTETVAFYPNQIKNTDNTAPTANDDIRYSDRDYGYHAGDLGKAEGYFNMMSANRHTGHFGTGTYFVGDEAQLTGNYAERPHEKVDFSQYRLFKPMDEKEGFRLHDALKTINRMILTYPYSKMTFDEKYDIKKGMDDAGYAFWKGEGIEEAIEYLEGIRQKYAWLIDRGFAEKSAEELTTDDYEAFADKHEELYEALNDIGTDFRRLTFDMQNLFGFRTDNGSLNFEKVEAKHNQILEEVYNESAEQDAKWDTNYNALITEDSPSTRYMKKWGYEGIDVRRFKGLDNTMYGSVIYDLKGEDLARKQEIGTAKYSDRATSSVHDMLGETARLKKENVKLSEDIARLRERLALEKKITNGNTFKEEQLKVVAKHLSKLANTEYDENALIDDLREVYTYIATTPNLDWEDLMVRAYDVARSMMRKQKPTKITNDYFKQVLRDIRQTRISLSEDQIAEAKSAFGEKYRNAFFGRVTLVNDGTSLDRQWQEWASKYPEIFDAEVSVADQIIELSSILDSLRDGAEMYQTYNDVEATRELAVEIYNQYWNVSTIRTTADKYDKQIKRLNFEHRKAMDEMRRDYKQRVEDQRVADSMHYGKIIKDIRSQRDAKVREAREYGKKRMTDYKDRVARNAEIERITKKALTLNQWLLKNSKQEHIPEVMKEPVAYLLSAIDFSSKQLLGMRGGSRANTPTKKDISLSKALEKVHDMVKGINDAQIGEDDIAEIYGTFADFPMGFADDVKLLSGVANDILRKAGDNAYVLNDMTLEQLEELDRIITTLKTTVTKMNKFLAIRHAEGVANLSQQDIAYLDSLGKRKTYEGRVGGADKMIQWGNATPYYAFKRFGEGGQKVRDAIMDGWDKYSFHVKEIIDYTEQSYTSKEAKEWAEDIKEFDILIPPTDAERASEDYTPQYQKVQMTVPQIMALYCTVKRAQAKTHLFGGGMRVTDFKGKKGTISQPEGAILTESELEKITSTLTDRQREVADTLQRFMNTTCSDWGNEVSMLRFGINQFGEENYFPIQSDRNNLAVDDETERNNSLFRLLNMSFTKGLTEGANNRIVIGDIFDVFAQHASDMAKYNAMALPILDAFKWYNYKEKVKRGKDTQFTTMSLKQSLETAFGKDAQNYITTLLRDINGAESGGRDSVGGGFFTNAKIASVGFNARVIALQPTSYVRANAVIDPKYLTKAFLRKPNIKMAEQYCGIALWKSLGFFDINIQKSVTTMIKHEQTTKDKLVEASMKGAEMADKLTWGYLWNACEFEVREKNPNLVGEELYKKVGLRLREVIYSTQVVDSTITRSQMMRSKDGRDKMITAFMSEPTLAYNMLQDCYYDWKLTERQTGSKEKAFKKHGKRMARVFTAYTVTNMLSALVEAGFDFFRDTDDEEITFEDFMKQWGKNLGGNMSILGKIPYAKEIISMLEGYSSSRTDTQWMQHFVNFGSGIVKLFEGNGNAYTTAKNGLRAFSYFTGLPLYNAWRDSVAVFDAIGFEAEELEEMFNETIGDIFPSLKSK